MIIIIMCQLCHPTQAEELEREEEQVEEAEEERGDRPRLVMRRMESETTSYDWSTDSESLR